MALSIKNIWRKTWVKVVTGILLLLTGAILAVPFFYREKAKDMIISSAKEQLNADLHFNDFSFSLMENFPELTFTMYNADLTTHGDFEGDTLIYTKEVEIALNIKQLVLDHEVVIHELHLFQPRIKIKTNKEGVNNYDIIKADTNTKDTSAVSFSFDEVTIKDGDIRFGDAASHLFFHTRHADLKGKIKFDHDIIDLDLTAKSDSASFKRGNVRWMRRKKLDLTAELQVDLKKRQVDFKKNNITIEKFSFSLDGVYAWTDEDYFVDLKTVTGPINFGHLLSLLPGVYTEDMSSLQANGDIQLSAWLKGWSTDSTSPGYGLDLQVKKGHFKYKQLPHPVEDINLQMHVESRDGSAQKTVIKIPAFHFMLKDDPVKGHLTISNTVSPYVNAEIKAEMNLAELKNYIPLDSLTLAGHLKADIKLNGLYDAKQSKFPETKASLQIENGYVLSDAHPDPIENIYIEATLDNQKGTFEDTRLHVDTLTFSLEGETFMVEGELKEWHDLLFEGTARGAVDLEKLTNVWPVENCELKGRITAELDAAGRVSDLANKNYNKIKAHGDVIVKGFSYHGPELPNTFYVHDADLCITPERLVLDKFHAEYGKSNMDMTGHLYHYLPWVTGHHELLNGDLNLTCDTLNIREWIVSSEESSSQNDSIFLVPRNIDFIIDSKIALVEIDSLIIYNLAGEISMHDGIMKISETGFTTIGSMCSMNGSYDTRDPEHPRFDMEVDIQNLEIEKAYRAFYMFQSVTPAAQNTNGMLTVKYKLSGEVQPDFSPRLNTLLGGGVVTLRNGKINGMKIFKQVGHLSKKKELEDPTLSEIIMETEIREGRIFIKPFDFKVNGFDASLEGSNDFAGNLNYVMRISLPHLDKVHIPFHIEGPYDNPKVKMFDKGKHDDSDKN